MIRSALAAIAELPSTIVVSSAAPREYPPLPAHGVDPGGWYLNTCAVVRTDLSPSDLLQKLHAIERSLGRVRTPAVRWGPRTIDLDLLVFGDRTIDDPAIHVPHPRLHERAFVLEPLAEIAPDLHVPGLGRVRDLLARLTSAQPTA